MRHITTDPETEAALRAQFPCPQCGAGLREVTEHSREEHVLAPLDADGRPRLYAPYEEGDRVGATIARRIVCTSGHEWFTEPELVEYDYPRNRA